MGFWAIILLIIQYGPMIFNFIKAAWELIQWLRQNHPTGAPHLGSDSECLANLKAMAARAKATRDYSELQTYVAKLQEQKAAVIASQPAVKV